MKNLLTKLKTLALAGMAMGLALGAAAANPTITLSKAQQRYPWNGKVDITYETQDMQAAADEKGVDVALVLQLIDRAATPWTTNVAEAANLSGDLTFSNGTHRIVWDLDAQGVTVTSTNVIFTARCVEKARKLTDGLYCIVDLSGGPTAEKYDVSYLNAIPDGGWIDYYKTNCIVLRKVSATNFMMQASASSTGTNTILTQDYFIGVFEVTQKQWYQVMGTHAWEMAEGLGSYDKGVGDTNPVYYVTYDMIRGGTGTSGTNWPASSDVDASSFFGKLRERTGLADFDLPTEAQWECACRAGTTNTYYWGNSDATADDYCWSSGNSGSVTHAVGTKLPNAWGLYDMSGNVLEWCLDWYGTLAYGTDPKGSSSGSSRVSRGGAWHRTASSCTSSGRGSAPPAAVRNHIGFRPVRTPIK